MIYLALCSMLFRLFLLSLKPFPLIDGRAVVLMAGCKVLVTLIGSGHCENVDLKSTCPMVFLLMSFG